MKLLVIGATGSVGTHIVQQALDSSHEVTAFARNPAAISLQHNKLHIHPGDVLNPDSLSTAVKGQDAVLCALGAGRDGSIRSLGTRNIVQVMQQRGVRRFICQTSLGLGDSNETLNFFWKHIMFGLLLRAAFADHGRQEKAIIDSQLDWTIVRPAAFTDGPLTGEYKVGFPGSEKGLKLKISRADVAQFMLQQLNEPRWIHKTPGLSY